MRHVILPWQTLDALQSGRTGSIIMSEKYTRGQVCDLTGHDRTVRVNYLCSHAGHAFTSIEEIMSCQYVVMLGSPELCKLANMKEVLPP